MVSFNVLYFLIVLAFLSGSFSWFLIERIFELFRKD